jgi:single-strand DNA-binding protein
MNSVNLHGHLAADPQAVAFESGAHLTRLRLAVRRPRPSKGEEAGPDFFDVQAWGTLGRAAAEHLSSGCALAISGRLRQHTSAGDDSHRRERVYIVADWIDFPPMTPRAVSEPNSEPTTAAIAA